MRNKAYTVISIAILCVLVLPGYLRALSCSISINKGATYTTSRSVTLNLSASEGEGNKYMRFNNDGGSWTNWESFSTSKSWELNDKDGIRTVYFEVKDSSPTPNVDSDNDSIILDRINPATLVYYEEGKGDSGWYIYVYVTLEPYDATSGVNYTNYKVGGTWKTHDGESDFSFYLPDGTSQEAEFYSVDNAGNQESHRYTDKKNVDGTKPVTTISLSGTAGDNGWYRSNVTVNLSASDATSGVNWIKYKIGFFGEKMTYSDPFTISDEGETTVYYWAKDVAGNEEWSNSINIKIDKTKPEVPVMGKMPEYTRGNSNTVSWSSVFDPTSDNVSYFVQCDDNSDFSSPYAQSGWITGTSYTFTGLQDETKYWYRVKAKDGAGNESDWSDRVFSIQDATDPRIIIHAPDNGFSSDQYKVSTATVTFSDNLCCFRMTGNVNGDSGKVPNLPWTSPENKVITSTSIIVNVEIDEGMNDITLIVEDMAGNSASKTVRVTYGIYTRGNFKFHYTTSPRYPIKMKYQLDGGWVDYVGRDDHVDNTNMNGNRIPDFVDDFAKIFGDEVWNFETGFMGRQPISAYYDYSTGRIMDSPPGSKYNIYIINVGANGIYGFADAVVSSGASYIAADNDYAGFAGSQSDNKKVTAAHEFFHAIQFTIDAREDPWWMEATAVWMEDEVYKYGRDITNRDSSYLQYFKDRYDRYGNLVAYGWFKRPETSLDVFDSWHEYGSVIFAKYLSENYDRSDWKTIKEIWDRCAGPTQSLEAIQNALGSRGGLADNFKTFTYWNYDKQNYEEGSLYRDYATKIEFSHSNYLSGVTRPGSIKHLASNYIEFLPDPRIPTDATTTQNLRLEISTTTTLWGGKVLKVGRAGEVVDVVNLASGDRIDIKGLGSNSTDRYSKVIT